MKITDFPWLQVLRELLHESPFNDLKVASHREVYLFDDARSTPVMASVVGALFGSADRYESELTRLAWHLELRFDPYHPYLSQDIAGVGRVTVLRGALLGGPSQMFVRALTPASVASLSPFYDPHHLLSVFEAHFCRLPWLICGPSGAGKSSLLFRELEKHFATTPVVVMDRFQEKPCPYPLWTYLREQPTQLSGAGRVAATDLLELSWKLGAGVLVFGEIRLREMESFFHGLFSGRRQVYATFHAACQEDLFARFALWNPRASAVMARKVGALFLQRAGARFTVTSLYLPPGYAVTRAPSGPET